jgi:hypothetical protein
VLAVAIAVAVLTSYGRWCPNLVWMDHAVPVG